MGRLLNVTKECKMQQLVEWKVNYDILTEARSGSYGGSSRTDMMNLTINVKAPGSNVAGQIVQQMFGGPNMVRINGVFPIYR